MFEAMIMNREISNPCYRFLFENQSPAHVYYRWKLFSILQGDSTSRWSTQPFRMFEGGSIWKPPPLNPFLQGMPEELVKQDEEEEEKNRRGSLSNAQRGRLEHMIRHLTPEREKVGEAMVWCIEHADAAEEICQCLCEALINPSTAITKKMARLYLVSDILHNCTVKVSNASFYRKGLQSKLQEIFEGVHNAHAAIESRLRAEQLKQRVLQCCRAWEDWAVYPPEFLISLQNIFLGLVKRSANNGMDGLDVKPEKALECSTPGRAVGDDVDGVPLDDVDGVPLGMLDSKEDLLDGLPFKPNNTPLLQSSAAISALQGYDDDDDDEDDLDGAPLDDDVDGVPLGSGSPRPPAAGTGPGFVPPKWESVSPQRVEAQAMTLSKWDTLEAHQAGVGSQNDESDSTPVYDQPDASPSSPAGDKMDHNNHKSIIDEDDLDGIPIVYEDYKRKKRHSSSDEESIEPKSMKDSDVGKDNNSEYSEDSRGYERLQGVVPRREASEERRARLREVEVRVMQYQDELEQGLRPLKPGYTLPRQVQHYRHKLLRKIEKEEAAAVSAAATTASSVTSGGGSERRHHKHRSSRSTTPAQEDRLVPSRGSSKRSRSPHKSRHRSRSPSSRRDRHRSRSPRKRKSRSRSPSRKHKKKRH